MSLRWSFRKFNSKSSTLPDINVKSGRHVQRKPFLLEDVKVTESISLWNVHSSQIHRICAASFSYIFSKNTMFKNMWYEHTYVSPASKQRCQVLQWHSGCAQCWSNSQFGGHQQPCELCAAWRDHLHVGRRQTLPRIDKVIQTARSCVTSAITKRTSQYLSDLSLMFLTLNLHHDYRT